MSAYVFWLARVSPNYGLRADYMSKFLESLRANGIESPLEIIPTTTLPEPQLSSLLHLSAQDPDQREFHLSALGGSDWHQIAESVTLSLTTRIEHARMSHGIAELDRVDLGENLRERFLALLPYLNFDAIAARILEFRVTNGWWNLSFNDAGLREGLQHGNYLLEGSPRMMTVTGRDDLRRLETIAVTLLQRLLRSAWRRRQAKQVCYRIAPLSAENDTLLKQIQIRKTS